jgi:6-phosphofructokinase 1
MLTIS